MENFEKLLQDEIDKLPYEKHLDDGGYNDGVQFGFEMGARWAKGEASRTSPVKDLVDKDGILALVVILVYLLLTGNNEDENRKIKK